MALTDLISGQSRRRPEVPSGSVFAVGASVQHLLCAEPFRQVPSSSDSLAPYEGQTLVPVL